MVREKVILIRFYLFIIFLFYFNKEKLLRKNILASIAEKMCHMTI